MGRLTYNELFPPNKVSVLATFDYTPELWEKMKLLNDAVNLRSKVVYDYYKEEDRKVIMWVVCIDEEQRCEDEDYVLKKREQENRMSQGKHNCESAKGEKYV